MAIVDLTILIGACVIALGSTFKSTIPENGITILPIFIFIRTYAVPLYICLLYTSDAADDP